MTRREFLKNASILGGMSLVLNSIPFSSFGSVNYLNKLLGKAENDNVLIMIQLHGGNDGLNTFIPINCFIMILFDQDFFIFFYSFVLSPFYFFCAVFCYI